MKKRRPSLRWVILFVNFFLLIFPIILFTFFRWFENELVRQTEVGLLAQAAFLRVSALEAMELEEGAPASDTNSSYMLDPELDLENARILPPMEEAPESERGSLSAFCLKMKRLEKTIELVKPYVLNSVRVVDEFGYVCASSADNEGSSIAHLAEFQEVKSGNIVRLFRQRDKKMPASLDSISRGFSLRISIAVPILAKGRFIGAVLLQRTPIDLKKSAYRNLETIYWMALGLLVTMLLITGFLCFLILEPVRSILWQVRAVQEDPQRKIEPLEKPRTQEMEELSRGISSMAKIIQGRADRLEQFARFVSHEFKTPLSSTLGAVEILKDYGESMGKEKRDEFLTQIAKDGMRLNRLTTELLEFARAGRKSAYADRTDLSDVREIVEHLCKKYGLNVDVPKENPSDAFFSYSKDQLELIFDNLLRNSKQHKSSHVQVRYEDSATELRIKYSDDGQGISAENRSKVFEPFFTTRRNEEGLGLGMAMVRALIESYRGTIVVESSTQGAAFTLAFVKN